MMVWLWFNTEPVSERGDHWPLSPYGKTIHPHWSRECWGGREMTREVEWCFCLLQNCVELYVYVYLFSCFGGMCFLVLVACVFLFWWHVHAHERMQKPKEQCFCLLQHCVELYVYCLLVFMFRWHRSTHGHIQNRQACMHMAAY